MSDSDLGTDLQTLNELLIRGVIHIDQVAQFIGVSRQIVYRWRKPPAPNMTARNAQKLKSFLESVQGAGSRGETAAAHTPQEQQKPTGSGGVVMSTETKQLLQDILSLPPSLQGTLRQNIDALKLLALRLEADKRTAAVVDAAAELKLP